jgi:hypothetical protein
VKVPPLPYEEVGATLEIVGEDGLSISAVTDNNGVATFTTPLTSSRRYKLLITTILGRKYATAFLENKRTPEIEKIGYKVDGPGIQLHVSSEDKTQDTRYYSWSFEETWKNQGFNSYAFCWNNERRPGSIYIASSVKFSADRISEFPLTFMDGQSRKLAHIYSINVFQYGLTKEAYDYLSKLKKLSEQIGGIFATQPSELTGNVYCLSNPSEKVIGFISCGIIREKRFFISSSEIKKINSDWYWRPPSQACAYPPPPEECLCLGTDIKPSYWPD